MDFTLNDDQRMLQDAVLRLAEREYRFEHRRAYAAEWRASAGRCGPRRQASACSVWPTPKPMVDSAAAPWT